MKQILITLLLIIFSFYIYASDFQIVTLQYPPYQYIENNELQGIAYEVVKEAFKRMGHSVKVNVYPWKRSLQQVKSGRADAIFTIYKTKEREEFLDYSNEILMPQQTAFFKLKNTDIEYNGKFENLKNTVISTVLGISYGNKFDNAVKENVLQVVTAYDSEKSIELVLNNRVQLFVSNVYGAKYLIRKMNIENDIVMLKPVIEDVPSYIAFSKEKNHTDLRDNFDIEIRKMREDGTYDRIVNNYFEHLTFQNEDLEDNIQ